MVIHTALEISDRNRDGVFNKTSNDIIYYEGNFGYKYSSDGNTIEIIDYIGSSPYVKIPDTINMYPVTVIGSRAFSRRPIVSMEFNSHLKRIESQAFADCSSLLSAYLPDGLETVDNLAFSDCPELSFIRIPDSLKAV